MNDLVGEIFEIKRFSQKERASARSFWEKWH